MIKWIFFDLGSTLIDESECDEFRLCQLLLEPGAPDREVLEKSMHAFARQNRQPYKETAKKYGLKTAKWPVHLEKLYPGVSEVLSRLGKKYRLGIIANQIPGTRERLCKYGICQYFDVVAASGDLGTAKPESAIFEWALREAGCKPEEAVMVGDRLDNDIEPAGKLGVHTVWVRQGSCAEGNPERIALPPDHIITKIEEICDIF